MEEIMKRISVVLVLFALFSFKSNELEEKYSLTITVNDLRNSEGVVQFAIYNTEGSIPDEDYEKFYKIKTATITDNNASITFTDLPKGHYAVNVLHDENQNRKIDKKTFPPLPKEGIGFSNYEKIGFSNRPKFSKAKFELNADMQKEVKIIYL